MGRFINADAFASTGLETLGRNMFAYCFNNPIKLADFEGYDAIVLFDANIPGHIGAMVQDGNDVWWHFYWGTRADTTRLICAVGISVEPYSWCYEYTSSYVSLTAINESNQYSGDYEELAYLYGDFSNCIDEFKNPQGDYNLYGNNCSQFTLTTLAKSDTDYQDLLSSSISFLPYIANESIQNNISHRLPRNLHNYYIDHLGW